METNYFVCTLGEAANGQHKRPYRNVNYLLRQQAQHRPDRPAIGFCKVNRTKTIDSFDYELLSFKQVQQGVEAVAELISKSVQVQQGSTVGLLSSSSPEFLFTWLACIRLGLSVLLIAPECSPTGITHLCRATEVKLVFADEKHMTLCQQAAKHGLNDDTGNFDCLSLPVNGQNVFGVIQLTPSADLPEPDIADSDIAYLHHTSGTSSGLPKPIPQTHRGSIGVLPALNGENTATFTTTPLYHGGPADIFRAWTSNALIWLYPSKDIPMTASNVVKCLETTKQAGQQMPCPPVTYFATVPYIVSMLLQDASSLRWLQRMAAVSVGGAALPQEIGDELVDKDVNLVSRFGSAECGFLMSSHRSYAQDKAWQYLRQPKSSSAIKFESQDSGLSELVVLSNWPHLAKRNRENGSYATADLFKPHRTLKQAWRYHSRADSQLTLVTGKKFDPAPVEDAVVAASSLISDALIFGNGEPYPGILVFRSEEASECSDNEVREALVPVLARIGKESQAHTRIGPNMIVPMKHTTDAIEKSSKGTVLRGRAEERYATEIKSSYAGETHSKWHDCPDEKLEEAIKDIVLSVLPQAPAELADSTDLFSIGVDSVAGIQIRRGLQQLLTDDKAQLPLTIVEDCGSVKCLADSILALRHGKAQEVGKNSIDSRREMLAFVDRYGQFSDCRTNNITNGANGHSSQQHIVLLTGTTGSLGAHVLNQLRQNTAVAMIYCLIRGADETAARERLDKALKQRRLHSLDYDTKVCVLRGSLSDEKLGLESKVYDVLARETTVIMHLAWSVNFRMKLSSFEKDSIAGVRNVLRLALASPHTNCPRVAFCSSVASAMAFPGDSVPEKLLDDPAVATSIGYSQSKWVAEQICQHAAEQTQLRGRISIFRVGQLSGDTQHGIWNAKEAWPLMLGSVKLTKTLPRIEGEILDWLPVDVAATAMIEGAFLDTHDESVAVYHIANNSTEPTWNDMLEWMHKRIDYEEVAPPEWIEQLDKQSSRGADHAAFQLLEHWRAAYAGQKGEKSNRKQFDMQCTKEALKTLQDVQPVNEKYFDKLWQWIDKSV